MAIIELPNNQKIDDTLMCSICRVKLLLSKATAGLLNAENRQAFACVSHLSEVDLLIRGWADFMVAERSKHYRRKREADVLGVSNVWLDT